MSTEPGPSPCHASKCPLLLALGHWSPLGFEIICPRSQYVSQWPESKKLQRWDESNQLQSSLISPTAWIMWMWEKAYGHREVKGKERKERGSFCPNLLWLLGIPCLWNEPKKAAKQEVEDKDINVPFSFQCFGKAQRVRIACSWQLLHCHSGLSAVAFGCFGHLCMARFLASSEKRKGILTHSFSSYRVGVSSYLIIPSLLIYQMLAKLSVHNFNDLWCNFSIT